MGAPDESPAASMEVQRPAPDPHTLIVTLSGRIDRSEATRLGERVIGRLRAGHAAVVVCDVTSLVEPDVAAVDAICRIRLAARRSGGGFRLHGPSPELLALVDLVGLCDALPGARGSDLESQGQSEQREHPRRVEEERDAGDPIA